MASTSAERASDVAQLRRILDAGTLTTAYQPLVHLQTGEVLGYEALARGPRWSALRHPADLFGAAARHGLTYELDIACALAALRGAAGLDPDLALFLNFEARTLAALRGIPDQALADRVPSTVVLEVTERAITDDPAGLLRSVSAVRRLGYRVALDDVGADLGSLALMPFVQPDVVKLDMRLVHDRPDADIARIVSAVGAHAERSGAVVLAEGIETPDHVMAASAMGATVGQGWLYGRPGPLPVGARPPRHGSPLAAMLPAPVTPARGVSTARPGPAEDATPWSLVAGRPGLRLATKQLMLSMSRHLELYALDAREPAVVLACFQDRRHFTSRTRARYASLASRAVLVGALGTGMADVDVPRLRTVGLDPADPLTQEWNVVVVGAHFAGALIARDLGDDGEDAQRRFEAFVTHDRDLVLRAASTLLRRVAPV